MRTLNGLALAVALFAPPTAALPDAGHKVYRSDFSCSRGPYALRVGNSLNELRSLGILQKETVGPPEQLGFELRILNFDGLQIGAVFPSNKYDKGAIDYVLIDSPQWSIAAGIKVGVPVEDLGQVLKQKLPGRDGKVEICGDTDCGIFFIKNRRVQVINYQCYTG